MLKIVIAIVITALVLFALGVVSPVTAQDSPIEPPDGFFNPPIYGNIIGINPIPTAPIESQRPSSAIENNSVNATPPPTRDDSDAGLASEGRRR